LAPVAIGLMISGTYTIARLSVVDLASLGIAIVVLAILLWRHINPGILVLGGGAVYMLLTR
jgi:chromate transport protein ChrA